MRTFPRLSDLAAEQGKSLGKSEWVTVTQEMIDQFAEVTGDHQWIHTDPERCKKELDMPTIAHGFLTLSMIPNFIMEILLVESAKRIINYGVNNIRFTSPVPVNSEIRGHVRLNRASVRPDMSRIIFGIEIEIRGGDKPVAVAEMVTLMFE